MMITYLPTPGSGKMQAGGDPLLPRELSMSGADVWNGKPRKPLISGSEWKSRCILPIA